MCHRGGCRCVIWDGILGGKIWFRDIKWILC